MAKQLFAGLPRHYDVLAEAFSFGQNRRWRKTMVDQIVKTSPECVLDVATGTGAVAIDLAERTPASIVGIDVSESMLERGREKVVARGYSERISLMVGRAEALPFPDESFDAVTFTYLLRYVADPATTLKEMVRVLRPGGVMASLEFSVPSDPIWRPCWYVYTRIGLPALGSIVDRAWFDVGRFLGPSIAAFYRRYPLSWLLEAWGEAGMSSVHHRVMSLGGGIVIWGEKAGG